MIYFDNSATSYPKPPEMLNAMQEFTLKVGANPGRSGHRLSVESGRILEDARESCAGIFNVPDPMRIVFTYNATYAINIALHGFLSPGDHVLTSALEHNAVARTLNYLREKGVEYTKIGIRDDMSLDLEELRRQVRPETRLIVLLHGSNVTGSVFDLEKIGGLSKELGLTLLVDAAQTAGCYPIDVIRDRIDLLAFTGHKGLLGPQGTGGLYLRPGLDLKPVFRGGTGSNSEHDTQPAFLPDSLEPGTPNTIGFAGLGASLRFILDQGVDRIRKTEAELGAYLLRRLREIEEVELCPSGLPGFQLPVFSFNLKGHSSSEVGQRLDDEYALMTRVGLHCSPWAHSALGTYPAGTIRFSLGIYNTIEEIDLAVKALKEIVSGGRQKV